MTIPATQTTQARHPWAAVRRTLLAFAGFLVVMAPAAPAVVQAIGLNVVIPWVATALGVAAAITRLLAVPVVEQWLREHVRSLAAAPGPK
jgi:hypothetical protein